MINRAVVTLLCTVWLAPALAAEHGRTISVSGLGTVRAPPDQALIDTGVVSESATARDALDDNNAAMARILSVLEELGVQPWDVQTTSFDVSPVYQRDQQRREAPVIIGYRVVNQVHVRVAALDTLGTVLDSLVRAGSNQLSGISFAIADPALPLEEARRRAMTDARARAELYAAAAGVRVGKILAIREQSTRLPRPQPMARTMLLEQASAVPVASGEQEVSASIDAVYRLVD